MSKVLYTIGHSNHEIHNFVRLLLKYGVSALGDVRSHPYSRFAPQYSQDALKQSLSANGIAYVFLGKELGARSTNPACYKQGKVQYDRLALEPIFDEGIQRVLQGMERYNIALMCSEKDPVDCHRALLVSRKLSSLGISIRHIHPDETLETQETMESRLLQLCKLPEGDMFKSRAEFICEAYAIHGERVAYEDQRMEAADQDIAI